MKISWSCSNLSSVSNSASLHSATSAFVASVGLSHSTPVLNCMCQHPLALRSSATLRQSVLTATSAPRATGSLANHPLGSLSHATSTSDTNTSCPRFSRNNKNAAFSAPICWNALPSIVTFAVGSCSGWPPVATTSNVYRRSESEWYGIPSDSHKRTVASSRAATMTFSVTPSAESRACQLSMNSWNPSETNVAKTGAARSRRDAWPETFSASAPDRAMRAAASSSRRCVLASTSRPLTTVTPTPPRAEAEAEEEEEEEDVLEGSSSGWSSSGRSSFVIRRRASSSSFVIGGRGSASSSRGRSASGGGGGGGAGLAGDRGAGDARAGSARPAAGRASAGRSFARDDEAEEGR